MRFRPTGRSTIASIPTDRKWSAGPMPESMRRRGESKAPAQTTTSPAPIGAVAPPVAGEVSTPETVPLGSRSNLRATVSESTVVVEAPHTSGARAQARLALQHGRPVFLPEPLLEEPSAREFANRPGAHVVREPEEITATIERLNSPGALVA